MARMFEARYRHHDVDDLVQEAMLALWKAVELFDVSRGFRFSTYASNSIWRILQRYDFLQRRNHRRFTPSEILPTTQTREQEADADQMASDTQTEAVTTLERAFENLDPREVAVLKLRFGIQCDGEHTLGEAGDVLKRSKERIRQIEKKALDKCRRAVA